MQARAAAAEATRDRIVDSAIELFIVRRYEDVTLREISKAAGVALQTVVNHFETKENVLLAAIDRFGAQVEELRGAVAPGDVRAAAAVLVTDYERVGEANLRLVALEDSVPAVAAMLAQGRAQHRAWVERTFPGALAGLRRRRTTPPARPAVHGRAMPSPGDFCAAITGSRPRKPQPRSRNSSRPYTTITRRHEHEQLSLHQPGRRRHGAAHPQRRRRARRSRPRRARAGRPGAAARGRGRRLRRSCPGPPHPTATCARPRARSSATGRPARPSAASR